MSLCFWCDFCQSPYSDLDPDGRAMQLQVPRMEHGTKVGIIGVERHQCGECTRAQNLEVEKRRAIAAGQKAAEGYVADAMDFGGGRHQEIP